MTVGGLGYCCRHSHAIKQLQQDLERGASYIEEVSSIHRRPRRGQKQNTKHYSHDQQDF